jgi:hypothetical protein
MIMLYVFAFQVLAIPRMLSTKGHGFGYLFSWYIALLLWECLDRQGNAGAGNNKLSDHAGLTGQFDQQAGKVIRKHLLSIGAALPAADILQKLLSELNNQHLGAVPNLSHHKVEAFLNNVDEVMIWTWLKA